MGMILGFFLVAYIAIAVGIYLFIKHYVGMKWVNRITLAILILIPTYDIIITNILGVYYCNSEPNPKTFIKKKVEYPISIYWEDNVYSGFGDVFRDEYGKTKYNDITLMIKRYLDGIHIKTIALNMPNGKIKVFKATQDDWANSKKIAKIDEANASLKYKIKDDTWATVYSQAYYDALDKDAKKIADRGVIYYKSKVPQMNYTVTFNRVELNPFVRKFLYSDEIKVIDNKTNEVIAYNRRIMHFFYNIAPDFAVGNWYYVQEPICGSNNYSFQFLHNIDIKTFLYNKYTKGRK